MKSNAREVLGKLGSQKAKHLGWRDMWAMVTKKGETISTSDHHNVGWKGGNNKSSAVEEYSRSTEFHRCVHNQIITIMI